MKKRIVQTLEFKKWMESLSAKEKRQIDSRMQRVIEDDHYGTINTRLKVDGKIFKGLAEFKFNSGIRIYFSLIEEGGKLILLIFGGNKNGQSKDIKKAAGLLRRYLEDDAENEA